MFNPPFDKKNFIMCVSPNLVKNPYRSSSLFIARLKEKYPFLYDYESDYIYVPCGRCIECVQSSQSSFVQRAVVTSLDHYVFFATLTLNDDALSHIDICNKDFAYFDIALFQRFMKIFRNKFEREFGYAFFTEYGGMKHRPHAHLLFFVRQEKGDTKTTPYILENQLYTYFRDNWSRNVGTRKNPVYVPNFTFAQRGKFSNFDFHYVNPQLTDNQEYDVIYYASKYMMKFDSFIIDTFVKMRSFYDDIHTYRSKRALIRPKSLISKNLGLLTDIEKDYINRCIAQSFIDNETSFKFYSPFSSRKWNLSQYYIKRCVSNQQLNDMHKNNPGFFYNDIKYKHTSVENGMRILRDLDKRNNDNFL